MTADPRIVPEARTLPELSYREVSELAYYGAKVLHPKSIRPVIEAGITLRVRNTFNPEHPGTLLTDGEGKVNGTTIKAVTAFRGMKLFTVEGRGMLGVPGVAARIFSAVATTGATVPLITEASSEQSLTFAVPCDAADEIQMVLERDLAEEIRRGNIDRVWATEEVTIVTTVCPGMRYRLGVAGTNLQRAGGCRGECAGDSARLFGCIDQHGGDGGRYAPDDSGAAPVDGAGKGQSGGRNTVFLKRVRQSGNAVKMLRPVGSA